MTGTVIAQAIPFAISPILTRIYTPEDFGIYALYMSIVSILVVFVTGRYELAIMLPKKEDEAINIAALSILISFTISFLTLIIIFLFNSEITELLDNNKISNWLYFIPLSILLSGIYQSANYILNRKKRYKKITVNKVVQSIVTSSTNLSMGFNSYGSAGLITGGIFGQSVATVFLGKIAWDETNKEFSRINKIKMISLMKKYKKLPFLNLPNALIDNIRLSGINILISKFFSTASLGQFSLAWKMVQTPMSIIGSSISQVFFQKIASCKKEELYDIILSFTKKMLLVSIPIFSIIYFLSEDLFIFIFGIKWKLAGQAASIMTPWLFLNFFTSPLSTIFIVLNKQEVMLVFSIFYMLVPLSLLYVFKDLEFLEVLNIITLSMSSMLVIFIFLVIFYTKREKKCIS